MTTPGESLPFLLCRKRQLGELTADAESEFWKSLAAVDLRETATGAAPQQATALWVAWDSDELRVLFHCEDTEPWATLTAHDAPLYEEEVVEVFLDPVGDLESYFEIEVNPLNAVLDVVLRRNRSGYVKDFAWHCEHLRTFVQTTASTWSAELSIPFRSLVAEPPRVGSRWRANFCRIDRPSGVPRELTAWAPTGRPLFHTPERFGVLEFSAAEAP